MSAPLDIDRSLLPSLDQLRVAACVAGALVMALWFTVVLPAERGEDATGIGTMLGLTQMGLLRQELSRSDDYLTQTGEMSVQLAPGESREIKLTMGRGGTVQFRWSASSGELYYDFHGEPLVSGSFKSYEKDTRSSADGVFEAPFEGTHGWYWKNKTDAPVTVTLEVDGVYGRMKQLD